MSAKVIYSECSNTFWVEIARQLFQEMDWQPCYWVSAPGLEPHVQEQFPDVVFHSNLEAIRGIPAPQFSDLESVVLDQPTLERFASCQANTLTMMDRMDGLDSFSYHERLRLFHRLLGYWLAVLDGMEPDMVVFSTTPHLIYDYVLYACCQARGINTTIIEFTKIPWLVYPMSTFEDETAIMARYNQLLNDHTSGEITLSEATEVYLARLNRSYDEIPAHMKPPSAQFSDYSSQADSPDRSGKKFLIFPTEGVNAKEVARLGLRAARSVERIFHAGSNAPRNYLKQPGKKIEDSFMTGQEYRAFRHRAERKIRDLEAYYDKLTGPVDLDLPYIYVALSVQPERTTSPLGGVFVTQQLMIDALSQCLPDGWNLYVKEHPTQFFPARARRNQSARTKYFYDDIISRHNVKLAPMSMSSFDLIDNSKAVAVSTGTVAWEAVLRGKPALSFGYAWYRGCEGVFPALTKEEIGEAVAKIAGGYQVQREKVRLFLQATEQVCFSAYVEARYARPSGISDQDNADALAKGIKRYWEAQEGLEVSEQRLLIRQ